MLIMASIIHLGKSGLPKKVRSVLLKNGLSNSEPEIGVIIIINTFLNLCLLAVEYENKCIYVCFC